MIPRAAPLLLFGTLLGAPIRAAASNPYLEIPPESEAATSRAHRYANSSNEEAFAELRRRAIPYETATPPWAGVLAPIRLKGPLHGVTIHGTLPPELRARSPFEILDARLALALDDFCALLASHDIVEIAHVTMYRPAGAPPRNPGSAQTRHPAGMAIDIAGFKKRSGRWLSIGPHWSPAVGSKTCGPGARALKTRTGKELLSIVCEARDRRIFTYMLTPHFDAAHHDHLHLEIRPTVKWFLVN